MLFFGSFFFIASLVSLTLFVVSLTNLNIVIGLLPQLENLGNYTPVIFAILTVVLLDVTHLFIRRHRKNLAADNQKSGFTNFIYWTTFVPYYLSAWWLQGIIVLYSAVARCIVDIIKSVRRYDKETYDKNHEPRVIHDFTRDIVIYNTDESVKIGNESYTLWKEQGYGNTEWVSQDYETFYPYDSYHNCIDTRKY